jgi:lipoate-protein ligase A
VSNDVPVLEVYEGAGWPPTEDLAFERWMLERAAAGGCCAFTYSWDAPVVVLGYAQDPEDVDLAWCGSQGIPVLRRLTGGTGVVHRSDLAFSLALPTSHPWATGVVGLYGRFLDVLEPALRSVGSEACRVREPRRASRVRSPICFEDQLADTLLVGDRKSVGCAQARRGGAVLIHAAVLLGLDVQTYSQAFRVPAERISGGLAPAVPDGDWSEVGRAIVRHLPDALGVELARHRRPALASRFLEPYRRPRWAPVHSG